MGSALSCANHLNAGANFYCPQCDRHLCVACSKHVWAATGFVDQCLVCGALLQKLGETRIVGAGPNARTGGGNVSPGAAAFFDRLPDILRYPIRPSVALTLAGLTVILAPLEWAIGQPTGAFLGVLGALLVWGLKMSMYFHMIQRTAHGAETLEPPDIDDVFDDFVWPVALILLASLPLLLGVFWYGEQSFGMWGGGLTAIDHPSALLDYPGPLLVVAVGFALLPLLTAIAALSRSAGSVCNPKLWIESLRIMADTYPIAVAAFYAVTAIEIFFYRDLLMDIYTGIDIPIVTRLVVTFLALLPLALKARILGALCEPYLGDFED